MNTLTVEDLKFSVKRSSRRRTLQITVDRRGDLLLAAPPQAAEAQLVSFVLEKRFWIYTKLAEKDLLRRPFRRKSFVSGEGFLYRGRSYRLKLVARQNAPLRLANGRFHLVKSESKCARTHFIRWYSERGKSWFAAKVAEYSARMQVEAAGVKVQDLGYRWGSCGKGNWLYFHWKSVLLPTRIAEYVVVHEIAHLHERLHTPEFWQRVERAMPDYERRKQWLAERGMDVEGL
ncbi:MAG TPA: SprT family zinc-dependent metalloprotease [Povalibacter sp.]|uniref:M48 family metallopeptidase n=1 Tax=Povalibacter sp. TaxID=1962978 RepID=UPI002CED564F|nr:SprT family zinc-dependent metalloprotease [Povalibacter sp.]HMN44238.1 SprT family zinc-dependent metalloprotease [Povalibacter sp.]